MTKKDIKAVFRERKIQINDEAVQLILNHLHKETILMADRCKQGNYKRLNPESFWVALGDWGFESGPRRVRSKH